MMATTPSPPDQVVKAVEVPIPPDSTRENAARSSSAPAPVSNPLSGGSPQPAVEGLDADGLRGYRVALAREARRFKRYPRQAIDAGWEGTAEIHVAVLAGGVTRDARVVRSSGHPVLDDAALEMLTNAMSVTPVPPTLLERSFAVSLPVVFEVPAE